MTKPVFILASASPRRSALLKDIGVTPDQILPAEIDETPLRDELPRQLALRLADSKAAKIAALHKDAMVLGADTVVACGRRILPKAETEDQVIACLRLLSGRRHHVYTGVALHLPGGRIVKRVVDSAVTFHRLLPHDIDAYVASGEGIGKAGGYAIQGYAAAHIRFISGSYSNIVGLPLFEVSQMLRSANSLKAG